MNVVVYGDFNCLLCYLASQRADHPAGTGAAGVEWPAVKRGAVPARWEQETAQAEALALPGERLPAGSPSALSNTAAAVAAYAEAITAAVAASLSWIVLPAGITSLVNHPVGGCGRAARR